MKEIYTIDTFNPQRAFGRLVSRTRLVLIDRITEKLKPLDLTAAQWGVVLHLADGSASTPAELARIMDYDPGAMTRLIDRLELKGFVIRARSSADRRSIELTLSESARALYPQILPMIVEVYNGLFKGFEKKEITQLEDLLLRVLEKE